jgi:hypothetical protein
MIWARSLRQRYLQRIERMQIALNGKTCDQSHFRIALARMFAYGHDPFLDERIVPHPRPGGAGSLLASKVGSPNSTPDTLQDDPVPAIAG